jgi:hypothetical protein
MANEEDKKSKMSKFLAFIYCASKCKQDDDDDKVHDLFITRVYQSKSLTELAQLRKELNSPKAVRSVITADEVEKKKKNESGKSKRRFRFFRKWGARNAEKADTPRAQEELEVDMADGESLPEEELEVVPGDMLMDGDAGNTLQ